MKDLFKGFKKTGEDDSSVHMSHENGHKIQIAKRGLSKKLRHQLSALPIHQAEGGEIKRDPNGQKVSSPETQDITDKYGALTHEYLKSDRGAGSAQHALEESNSFMKNAKGYADGGDVEQAASPDQKPVTININNAPHPSDFAMQGNAATAEKLRQTNANEAAMAAASDAAVQQRRAQIDAQALQQTSGKEKIPSGASDAWDAPTMPKPESVQNVQSGQPQPASLAPQAAPAPANVANTPAPKSDPYNVVPGYKEQAGAIEGLGREDQKGKAAEAELYNNAVRQQAMDQLKYDQELGAKEKEVNLATDDFRKGHIKPQHIYGDDTWRNVRTGIGLLLGGMGAGIAHEANNPVLDQLNKQIQRDMDAQMANVGNKKSLMSALSEQYGNKMVAMKMHQAMSANMLANEISAAAAKSGSQKAQLIAQDLKGKLMQQVYPLLRQANALDMASKAGAQGQGGNPSEMDPASLVQHLVPEAHQKEVFKEIGSAQNTARMGDSIMQAFEDAVKENTVMRTGAGMLRTPGSVYALHQNMQPTFADLEGTVRQAAMDNTFKNVTPVPGDSDHKVDQKRQALKEYLKSKSSAPTAKGYGIDLSKFKSTRPAEGKPEMQKMNGVPYIKVNGGWKRAG